MLTTHLVRCRKRVAGFVPQEDILTGSQTVREALMFYASLKLPTHTPSEEKDKLVDGILRELGLKKIESSLIGYVGADALNSGLKRGISGGERKRLSIGCQLVSNPSLLFLDEPTTGLDSFAAHSVIKTLQKLSREGRTIIYTIHQPSSEIVQMFDKALVLGRGRTVYFGPQSRMLPYFAKMGFECPSWENEADFVMQVVHGDVQTYEDKVTQGETGDNYAHADGQAVKLNEAYLESDLARSALKAQESPAAVNREKVKNKPGFFKQVYHVAGRQLMNLIREPSSIRAGLAQTIFISLIMGLVYLRLGFTQADLQNRTGALFFSAVFVMFGGLLGPIYLFPTERKVFLYQSMDGLYSTGSYYASKLLAEIPSFAVSVLIFNSIFYWMVNFKATAGAFFIACAYGFLLVNAAFAFGVMMINVFPDPSVALNVFPLLFMPLMIFSGFYLNVDNTPPWFIWIEHLSFLKYGFRMAFNNEFEGAKFECKESEFQNLLGTKICPTTTGDLWRRFWVMDQMPIWADAGIIILMIICYHLVGFVLMRSAARKSAG
jgi:ATP-binding cassette, subfamily G (WHITE), eye pigment precursor transporter